MEAPFDGLLTLYRVKRIEKKNEPKFYANQSVFRIIKRWLLSLSWLAVLKRWSSSIIDLLLEIPFGCVVLEDN